MWSNVRFTRMRIIHWREGDVRFLLEKKKIVVNRKVSGKVTHSPRGCQEAEESRQYGEITRYEGS